MLSVLLIAAISAIVFSIATIAINEIRSSSELTKSEPIIKADEAVAEEALYKSIRGFAGFPTCNTQAATTVGSVIVNSCTSYYLGNPYIFNLSDSARRDFYLYNPVNQTQPPGYTSASVTITAGSTGTVYFCLISEIDCVANPSQTQALSVNGTTTWNSGGLNTNDKYQLIIVNGVGSGAVYAITANPSGLPAGTTTIISEGTSQGSTRSLQVDIPQ